MSNIIGGELDRVSRNIDYNLNGDETISGDTRTRYLASELGYFFKSHPEYTTSDEKMKLEVILGDTSRRINAYIEKYDYQVPANTLSKNFDWENIYTNYDITIEKCRALSEFITQTPFCLIVSDRDAGKSPTEPPKLCFPITIRLDESNISMVASSKLSAIRLRMTSSKVKLFAASATAMSSIQESISRLNNEATVLINRSKPNRECGDDCTIV